MSSRDGLAFGNWGLVVEGKAVGREDASCARPIRH
jgi:hypothetical protein